MKRPFSFLFFLPSLTPIPTTLSALRACMESGGRHDGSFSQSIHPSTLAEIRPGFPECCAVQFSSSALLHAQQRDVARSSQQRIPSRVRPARRVALQRAPTELGQGAWCVPPHFSARQPKSFLPDSRFSPRKSTPCGPQLGSPAGRRARDAAGRRAQQGSRAARHLVGSVARRKRPSKAQAEEHAPQNPQAAAACRAFTDKPDQQPGRSPP